MKWLGFVLAVVVISTAAGFAIYAWDSREDTAPTSEDQAQKARAAAKELAALCDPDCEVVVLKRVAPGVWKLNQRNSEGERVCLDIIVDDFRVLADGSLTGVVGIRCWGGENQ